MELDKDTFTWNATFNLYFDKKLSPEYMNFVEQALGYVAKTTVRAEAPVFEWLNSGNNKTYMVVAANEKEAAIKLLDGAFTVVKDDSTPTLEVYMDVSKSVRDDIGDIYTEFLDALQKLLKEGSPIRSGRRNMREAGTRLINRPSEDFSCTITLKSDCIELIKINKKMSERYVERQVNL